MSDINITNNFNAPIGQHIDHVETINLQMDGDGQFHFGMVEKTSYQNQNENQNDNENQNENNVELFHFIHPEIEDEEALHIHVAMKRIVVHQKVTEICEYLKDLKKRGKVILPASPATMYNELKRMGMPTGEGYTEKHFRNYYLR